MACMVNSGEGLEGGYADIKDNSPPRRKDTRTWAMQSRCIAFIEQMRKCLVRHELG
jgi:hypothetical protein